MYCRAATGMGFSKRELYSDDDDTIYNFKRCIGLNGINPAARRADLLDRSMLVPTAKITNGERKTEEIINSEFENAKAAILGGFLSILVKALKLYPSIKPDGLFRMADFARYGCAIAQVLGKTSDDFIKAYEQKVESQNEEAINASPVASTILDLCQIHFAKEDGKTVIDTWENTPTELYQLATNHAQKLGIRTDNRGSWPKAPNAFTRILNDITPSLFGVGYEITIKEGFPRKVIITTGKQASLFPSSKGRYCKNDIEVNDSEKSTKGEKPEPDAKDKPTFCVRKTPQAEKCDCGNFAVEYEIITPQHDMLKRCENCFNNLRVQFAAAVWKQGYPDLPNFEEKSEEAP